MANFWLFSVIVSAPSHTTGRCRTREARLSATYLWPMHAGTGHDRIKAGCVHWLMLDLVPFSSLFLLARRPPCETLVLPDGTVSELAIT